MVHTNAKCMYRNAMAHMQMQMYVTSYSYTNTNHFSVMPEDMCSCSKTFRTYYNGVCITIVFSRLDSSYLLSS